MSRHGKNLQKKNRTRAKRNRSLVRALDPTRKLYPTKQSLRNRNTLALALLRRKRNAEIEEPYRDKK